MKHCKLLVLAMFGLCTLTLSAQFQSAQLMGSIPGYQGNGNPAAIGSEKVHVMLPLLSGVNVAAGHTAFSFNDVVEDNTLHVSRVMDAIDSENSIWMDHRIPLFQAGFRTGSIFWRTGVATQVQSRVAYPGDLVELLWKGNGHPDVIGRRLDFSGMQLHAAAYTDYYVGATYVLPVYEMTVGANVHYLAGLGSVHTEQSAFGLSTDADDYTLMADGSFDVYTSGIGDLDSNAFDMSPSLMMPGSENSGFAFDFGTTANVKGYRIEGVVNNLGWMNWRANTQRYTLDEAAFAFSGLNLEGLTTSADSTEAFLTELTDSLTNTFQIQEGEGHYRVATNASFHLTVSREFWDRGRVYAGLNQNRRFGTGMGGAHAGVIQGVGRNFRVQGGLQWFNRDQLLVSMGMALQLGPCFIHAQAEHLPGLISPFGHRTWQASAGIALKFGQPDAVAAMPE